MLVNIFEKLVGEEKNVWRCECDNNTFFSRISADVVSYQRRGLILRRLIFTKNENKLYIISNQYILGLFPLPNHYVWEGIVDERSGLTEIDARFRFNLFLRVAVTIWFLAVTTWIIIMFALLFLEKVQLVKIEPIPGGLIGPICFGAGLLIFGILIVALLRLFGRSSKQHIISVLSLVGCRQRKGQVT